MTRLGSARPALFSFLLMLVGCGVGSRVGANAAVPIGWELLTSTPVAQVDDIAHRFYESDGDPEGIRRELSTLLGAHPNDGLLHEMAGYAAMLAGDDQERWEHFMRAARDLRAPLTELYIWEALQTPMTAAQIDVTIEFLQHLAQEHPRWSVRAFAADAAIPLLERLGRREEIQALWALTGLIPNWQVLGSFDSDQGKGFLTVYPPEEKVDLKATYQGMRVRVGWRQPEVLDNRRRLPLSHMLSPTHWSVAYALSSFTVPHSQSAQLRLSASDSVRAWVNGHLVLSDNRIENSSFDNVVVPITLRAGSNTIVIKTSNDDDGWSLGVRLTDEIGRVLPNVEFESTDVVPDDSLQNEVDAPVVVLHPLVQAADGVAIAGRQYLLSYRVMLLLGRVHDARESARKLISIVPGNLLANFHAAMSFWDNEELGKAIDIMNQMLKKFPDTPSLLVKRARFFKQKSLWDKALVDLRRAVVVAPASLSARDSLADLYERRGWQVDRCLVLEEIRDRWPQSSWTLMQLAHCVQKRGYYAAADRWWLEALELEPSNVYTLRQLASMSERRQNFESAIGYRSRIVELQPWRGDRWIERGDLYRRAELPELARLDYARARELSPHWPRSYHRLGLMAYEQADKEKALEYWENALIRNPTNTSLADHIDFLRPPGVGVMDRYVPDEAQINSIIAGKDSIESEPGAQILDLLDHEVTRVNQDGSSKRIVTSIAVALNEKGRDQLIVARLPGRGRLKLLQAYSIAVNGTVQQASSIREGTIRFRNVEVGAVVVVQYLHYAPAPEFLPNHFVASWLFQGVHRQHDKSEWVLIMPADRELKIERDSDIKEHTISDVVDGEKLLVRTFSMHNAPSLVAEPFMLPLPDLLKRVVVSTVSSWEEYAQWERALLMEAFREDARISELAHRLTRDAQTVQEKLDRLFHYVAQEVRYQQDYENTIAGVKPHSAPVVIERGYGDCKDKSVLMILLAREVGVELEFAILRTTSAGEVLRAIPNQQFNHAIVYAPVQPGLAEPLFLDPTTDGLDMGNLRADDQGAWSLVLNTRDGTYRFVQIPYQTPDMQKQQYGVKVDIRSPQRAEAVVAYRGRGNTANRMRQIVRNGEQAKKLYANIGAAMFTASSVNEASVRHHDDIWQPLEMDLRLDVSGTIQVQGEHWRLRLPGMFPLTPTVSLSARTTPMRLGVPDSLSARTEVAVPPGYMLKETPQDFEYSDTCFSVRRRTQRSKRSLTIEMDFERTCVEVEVDDYGKFRDAVRRVASATEDFVIFGRP